MLCFSQIFISSFEKPIVKIVTLVYTICHVSFVNVSFTAPLQQEKCIALTFFPTTSYVCYTKLFGLLLQTCTTYFLFHAFLRNAENAASQVFSQQKFLVMHYGNIIPKFRTSLVIMFHYFFDVKYISFSHMASSVSSEFVTKCCFMKLSRSGYRSTICTLLV